MTNSIYYKLVPSPALESLTEYFKSTPSKFVHYLTPSQWELIDHKEVVIFGEKQRITGKRRLPRKISKVCIRRDIGFNIWIHFFPE